MADVSDPRSRSIARRGVPASLHRRSRRARPAEAKPIGIENPDSLAPSASAPSTGSTEPRRPSSWSGATQVSTWSCRPRRRVRDAGATGQLTVRADSGFYAHAVVAAARRQRVRFSITIRQSKGVRRLIEAIPEDAWTPIPYWIEGGADVAETTYIPFKGEKDAVPVRLIVRRVKPTPGSQLALFALYDFHGALHDRPQPGLASRAGQGVHRPQASRRQELGRSRALPQAPGVPTGLPTAPGGPAGVGARRLTTIGACQAHRRRASSH